MSDAAPTPIEVEPPGRARAAVICLHGLGGAGCELAPLARDARLDPALGVRWVFPTAATRALSAAGGEQLSAWFDVGPDDLRKAEASDLSGLKAADALVRALIEREAARGVPTARIVVGGFSQGGALACYAAVRYTRPLAGAFALSSYLARNVEAEAEVTPANRSLPVFAAQGTLDTLVPPARGRELRARLERLGCPVTWREYPMGHELCLEEIGALAAWLAHVLGPG